jgi:hypothetical protein
MFPPTRIVCLTSLRGEECDSGKRSWLARRLALLSRVPLYIAF